MSIARLVRHPGQCTSSHGVPAVMAHLIVGDHNTLRSPFHRSTMLRAALRAASSAAWAASSAARLRIKSATLGVLRYGWSSGMARQVLDASYVAATRVFVTCAVALARHYHLIGGGTSTTSLSSAGARAGLWMSGSEEAPAPRFAGVAGSKNCQGTSVSALATKFGGLEAAALGFSNVQGLQDAIRAFCRG